MLTADGIESRVVSMLSRQLFERQAQAYREAVLPPSSSVRVNIEAPFGSERYIGSEGAIIGAAHFGASAPGPVIMRDCGFTLEHAVKTAMAPLKGGKGNVSE